MPEIEIHDNLTVREGLEEYFRRSGFGRETYTSPWVVINFGFIPVVLPNIPSRKRAVPLHDVDHVLTGYPTTLAGEIQIACFELGAGMGPFWFGGWINLQGFLMVPLIGWQKCFKAFIRGRRSGSVYRRFPDQESTLNFKLGELRRLLPVRSADEKIMVFNSDRFLFLGYQSLSWLVHFAILASAIGFWVLVF